MNSSLLRANLAVSATICGILQFLSGVLVCKKIVHHKSTGDTSGLAFVTCFMSCSLWLLYGILIQDSSIVLVNAFGALLQILYTITFYIFTVKKKVVVRQILLAFIFVSCNYLYWYYSEDSLLVTRRIGLISCTITVLFFASPLTLLAHVMRVKSAESLPYPVILSSFIVSCQWFLYGYLLEDYFIQIPNFLGCVLSAFQLSLFFVYPNNRKNDQELLI